jgi:hypothetical protein
MSRTMRRSVVAGALLATLLGRASPDPSGPATGQATLELDGSRIDLAVTRCALLGGRFLEQLPPGGVEVSLVADGRDADGSPVRVIARRGTDEVAPHRFDLLEVAVGEVEHHLEVLVVLRGFDRDTGSWTQVDPDAPDARRPVTGPLFDLDGTRLRARSVAPAPTDGRPVPVSLEATCPTQLGPDPGLA